MVLCQFMNRPSILLFLGLAAVAPAATSPATEKSAAATHSPAKATSAVARPVVHLGMTPEAVAKLIGRPAKVEAIKTPAGAGERWIYRRLAREWTQQTAATVEMVPSFVGAAMPNEGIGEAAMPAQHLERVRVYQVSSLLFVGNKLVATTQWPEKESHIEN